MGGLVPVSYHRATFVLDKEYVMSIYVSVIELNILKFMEAYEGHAWLVSFMDKVGNKGRKDEVNEFRKAIISKELQTGNSLSFLFYFFF